MHKTTNDNRRGATMLEFVMVGVPLILVLLSVFEMARGMWIYDTLEYAVKEGVRYTVVHGQGCAVPPNSCTVTISQIASVIQAAGPGLSGDSLTLTFTPATGSSTTCTITECIASYSTASWPGSTANAPGAKVKIAGTYPFRSTILMFWPGAGRPTTGGPSAVTLAAASREAIQY